MMSDDLLLSPEITMHEEPGHITINRGEVSVEIDDDEPVLGSPAYPSYSSANGELSITKVTGSARGHLAQQQRPTLKVRNDLIRPNLPGAFPPNMRPVQVRPPPLTRGALPPMPRLKLGGGPRVQRAPSPLTGMMNLQKQMFPPHRMFSPNMNTNNGMPSPRGSNMKRPPPSVIPNGNSNKASHSRSHSAGASYPFHPPNVMNPPRSSPTVINVNSPQVFYNKPRSNGNTPPPPMMRPGGVRQQIRPLSSLPKSERVKSPSVQVRTVFVPPPMKMNKAKKSAPASSNGTMTKQMNQLAANSQSLSDTKTISFDDNLDEEITLDEEELDDVEPDVDPKTKEVDDVEPTVSEEQNEKIIAKIDKHQVTVSITPKVSTKPKPPLPLSAIIPSHTITPKPILPKQESSRTVQYARRADGKGFVRKVVDKRTIIRVKKKKKKPFKGANYRFDGSSIKRRSAKKTVSSSSSTTTTTPAAEGEFSNNTPRSDGAQSPQRDPEFLQYLGIHRKESPEVNKDLIKPKGHKAKKSFKGR